MMPILLPMAVSFGTPIPLIVGAIAGGAVFGDHTSPSQTPPLCPAPPQAAT